MLATIAINLVATICEIVAIAIVFMQCLITVDTKFMPEHLHCM